MKRNTYKNSKRIGFVDKLHYKKYPNLSIGQYLKRIAKINNNTLIRIYNRKDRINHYFEINENSTEEYIDKIMRVFRKAGCIFDGYSINPRH